MRLSKQSRSVDLGKLAIYELVLEFCVAEWPDAGVFGSGMVKNHYLAPVGMVRNHSYVEYNGICYGAFSHTSGRGYCYQYIDGRYPVRIEQILHIEIPGGANLRTVCALVRRFKAPPIEPHFPWDTWASHLGVSSWAYDGLEEVMAVQANCFSGALALFDVEMSYGRYWVTVALDSVSPERDDADDDLGDNEGGDIE
ncbi:hypothetical protein FRC12_015269 [Ceratobasidium sp. 428]|nr:hypothetical protein FRC12_015269 [Ceratobasidium sp. 428]